VVHLPPLLSHFLIVLYLPPLLSQFLIVLHFRHRCHIF
jgi:hypothetical protein